MIGSENSRDPFDQSDAKLKTIATLSFAFFFPRFEFSLADNDVNLCFDYSLWLLPINLALFFSTQSKSALSVRSWLVNAFKALKVYYVTEEKKTAGKIDIIYQFQQWDKTQIECKPKFNLPSYHKFQHEL